MEFLRKNYAFFIIFLVIPVLILFLINNNEETKEEEKIIHSNTTIIGDSRMVGLCSYSWYKAENGTCIAKEGIGYDWFISYAINDLAGVENAKKENIVVNLGVNDLYNINNYISKYKELANNEWKESKIFILSVNPTKGGYDHLNEEIDSFNKKLMESFSEYDNIYYCDSNSYLKNNGFTTSDGLHYTNETSKLIYEEIKKCISNN